MPGSNGVPVATFVRLLVLDRDREANAVCVCVWLPRCYPASWSGASCCYEATGCFDAESTMQTMWDYAAGLCALSLSLSLSLSLCS